MNKKLILLLLISLIIGCIRFDDQKKKEFKRKPRFKSFRISEEHLKEIICNHYFSNTIKEMNPVENINTVDIVEGNKIHTYFRLFNLYEEEYFLKADWIGPDGDIFDQCSWIIKPDALSYDAWTWHTFYSLYSPEGNVTVKLYINNKFFSEYNILFVNK